MTDDLQTVIPDEDAEPAFDPEDEAIDDPDLDAADAPEGWPWPLPWPIC